METAKANVTITATATAAGTPPGSRRDNNRRSRWNRNSSANNSKKIRGLKPRFFYCLKKGTVQYLIVTPCKPLFSLYSDFYIVLV